MGWCVNTKRCFALLHFPTTLSMHIQMFLTLSVAVADGFQELLDDPRHITLRVRLGLRQTLHQVAARKQLCTSSKQRQGLSGGCRVM